MTGQTPASDELMARAEFYLLLSAVLNPGNRHRNADQLQNELLPDLMALSETLPGLTDAWLNGFRRTLKQLANGDQPEKEYSRLFLVPPAPCPLNLGYHLDGGLMGRTVAILDACYHRYGLERGTSFHDLPDHLSLNLQWLAWVMALAHEQNGGEHAGPNPLIDAAGLISGHTLPAVERLCEQLNERARERALSELWPDLLGLLRCQLQEDNLWLKTVLGQAEPEPDAQAATTPQTTTTDTLELLCRGCGIRFVADDLLAMMIPRLREAGLSTEHLERCPECRDQNPGTAPMTPPGARRFG